MKKFTKKQNVILSEIYRRLNYFCNGNLNTNLLLLDIPSNVKVISEFGLIKPYNKEIPRTANWYNLTEKGKKFFAHYVTKGKLGEQDNTDLFEGRNIIKFNPEFL